MFSFSQNAQNTYEIPWYFGSLHSPLPFTMSPSSFVTYAVAPFHFIFFRLLLLLFFFVFFFDAKAQTSRLLKQEIKLSAPNKNNSNNNNSDNEKKIVFNANARLKHSHCLFSIFCALLPLDLLLAVVLNAQTLYRSTFH